MRRISWLHGNSAFVAGTYAYGALRGYRAEYRQHEYENGLVGPRRLVAEKVADAILNGCMSVMFFPWTFYNAARRWEVEYTRLDPYSPDYMRLYMEYNMRYTLPCPPTTSARATR
jgi:hypothetical protein